MAVRFPTSPPGEARATESGENFEKGFNAASGGKLTDSVVKPTDPADSGDGKDFQKNPDTLYFHKVQNPDGTEKTPGTKAYDIANDYQNFVANDEIIAGAEETIGDNADIKRASHDLLSQIFTDEFLAKLENGEYTCTTPPMAPRRVPRTARRAPTRPRTPMRAAKAPRRSRASTTPQ